MAPVRFPGGIGHTKHDHKTAARVRGAGYEPLAAIDHIVLAIASDGGAYVGRIGGSDIRLGHGKAGTDPPLHERVKPCRALRLRREKMEQLHVPGVRLTTIEDFRRPGNAAPDL